MGSLGGGHVHFHLYRNQFVSDWQTVWDGDLTRCNTASNFFIWPLDVSNSRFWPLKKFLQSFLALFTLRVTKKCLKKVQKNRKDVEKKVFLNLFLMCSDRFRLVLRHFPGLPKPFLTPLHAQLWRQCPFRRQYKIM